MLVGVLCGYLENGEEEDKDTGKQNQIIDGVNGAKEVKPVG